MKLMIKRELELAKKNKSPDYESYERELMFAKYRGKTVSVKL